MQAQVASAKVLVVVDSLKPKGDSDMKGELPVVLARQITMLGLIPRLPGKVSASQLQKRLESDGFEVDLRSIQRDLQKLQKPMDLVRDAA
jgi:hypothetical protein